MKTRRVKLSKRFFCHHHRSCRQKLFRDHWLWPSFTYFTASHASFFAWLRFLL